MIHNMWRPSQSKRCMCNHSPLHYYYSPGYQPAPTPKDHGLDGLHSTTPLLTESHANAITTTAQCQRPCHWNPFPHATSPPASHLCTRQQFITPSPPPSKSYQYLHSIHCILDSNSKHTLLLGSSLFPTPKESSPFTATGTCKHHLNNKAYNLC